MSDALELAVELLGSEGLDPQSVVRVNAAAELRRQHREIERLWRVIDSRPQINQQLYEKYARWHGEITEMQILHALTGGGQ